MPLEPSEDENSVETHIISFKSKFFSLSPRERQCTTYYFSQVEGVPRMARHSSWKNPHDCHVSHYFDFPLCYSLERRRKIHEAILRYAPALRFSRYFFLFRMYVQHHVIFFEFRTFHDFTNCSVFETRLVIAEKDLSLLIFWLLPISLILSVVVFFTTKRNKPPPPLYNLVR